MVSNLRELYMERRQNPQAKCSSYENVSYIPYVKSLPNTLKMPEKLMFCKNHPHYSTPFIPFSTWNKPLHLFNLVNPSAFSHVLCSLVPATFLKVSSAFEWCHHLVLFLVPVEFHPNLTANQKKRVTKNGSSCGLSC